MEELGMPGETFRTSKVISETDYLTRKHSLKRAV